MTNQEKSAFPITKGVISNAHLGLTKREYFAALAMQATDLEAYANKYGNKWAEEVAKDSIQMADELLKQLET